MTDRKSLAKRCVETIVEEVRASHKRIQQYIHWTPVERCPWLSDEKTGTSVYFKLESQQVTGSFKVRGAFNKICQVKTQNENFAKSNTVITASSGNHGKACAFAMQKFGIEGKIFLPEHTERSKINGIEKFGGKIEIFGDDCIKAEEKAKLYVQQNRDCVWISPYCDTDVVSGNGTVGLEILEDLPDVDTVFVNVGGGGLISGIAAYIKTLKPSVKIIGCQPMNSCVMFESCKAGKILDLVSHPTLSDGSAGGVDPDAFTFDICCDYVDQWVIVSEKDISQAMFFMLEKHCKLIEGAAAVCIAAYTKNKLDHIGENIVLVICGANVGFETIRHVIEENTMK